MNWSELLQLVNVVFWSEVAAASSLIESPALTPPVVSPEVELTPVTVVVEPVPLHVVFEKVVFVRVNVVPLGAAIAFTLPSVNVICAVQLEVWPVAVARNRTPRSEGWTMNC